MDDYFKLPRISNSDLSQFRELLLYGTKRELPQHACNVGHVFHSLLLEPELPVPQFEKVNYKLLSTLVEKVRGETLVAQLLKTGSREEVILFDDPCSKARCRAKIDLHQDGRIIDFKTTYARSQAEFEASLYKLHYDKQAAFYVDSIGAQNFIFVGVQKQSPFNLYYFDCSKHPDCIPYGRKKYKKLLKEYVSYYRLAENNYYKWGEPTIYQSA